MVLEECYNEHQDKNKSSAVGSKKLKPRVKEKLKTVIFDVLPTHAQQIAPDWKT